MKNILYIFTALTLTLQPLAAFAAPTITTVPLQARDERIANDRLIVKFKSEKDIAAIDRLVKRGGGRIHKRIGKQLFHILKTNGKTSRDKLRQQLLRDSRIESVDFDRGWKVSLTPNDPLYVDQWHLPALQTPRAWDATTGNSSLIIAVLDTGLDDSTHEFANVVPGWNTFEDSSNTADTIGHGTWVSGTIVGAINNATGIAGASAQNSLMPIKVTDSEGYGYTSTIADALTRAADNGARIANISFEIYSGDAIISEAARYFVSRGGLVFAAAGNSGARHDHQDNPYIISVGSTNQSGAVSSFSSTGPYVDLAAPGEGIVTTGLNDTYVRVSGTSFASPLAAGAAALVWAANPVLNNMDVLSILSQTARDIGTPGIDETSGHGLIDAATAVWQVKPAPMPTPVPEPAPIVEQSPAPSTSTPKLKTHPDQSTPSPTSTPVLKIIEHPGDNNDQGRDAEAHQRNAERKEVHIIEKIEKKVEKKILPKKSSRKNVADHLTKR